MRLIYNLPVIALAVTAVSTNAATWKFAGESQNGAFAQFDTDSIRTTGEVTAVWIAYDFSKTKTEAARSAKSKVEFNCANWKSRTLSIIRYNTEGVILQDARTPYSMFDDIIPESFGDNIAKAVCDYAEAVRQ